MKKLFLLLSLTLLLFAQAPGFAGPTDNATGNNSSTAIAEARYNRLMRTYVNKVKLAFVQPEEAQTLAMLKQYSTLFIQESDAIKTEILTTVKTLPENEAKLFFERLAESSRDAEMIALLFDERISGRMQHNPEIKKVMETLHTKSLEIPNAGRLAVH